MDDIFSIMRLIEDGLFALIILEMIRDWLMSEKRNWREGWANLGVYAGNKIIAMTVIIAVPYFLLKLLEPYAFANIEMNGWWAAGLVLLVDFTYYWKHRFEHTCRFFWTYHSVHHSSEEYDLSTAYRLPWIGGFFEWVFFVPLVFAGFDALHILVAYEVVLIAQFWIHTKKIGKLGPLELLLNTPSHHRVHHASNEHYLDKNFGGMFIIWDKMFGTFRDEKEEVRYGLTTPIATTNPIKINFDEFLTMLKDAFCAKTWSDSWNYLFAAPGWQPQNITRKEK